MENSSNITDRTLFYKKAILFFVLLILFVVFLNLLIQSLRLNISEYTPYLAKSNYIFFVAFFFGIIATAVVQSSSAITSLTVALVATGSLTLHQAIPVVIGSNIGTTITPFIFSFIHSERRGQFKRALTVAFTHNLFNVLTAALVIFLEFKFSLLHNLSAGLGHFAYSQALQGNTVVPALVDYLEPITRFVFLIIKVNWVVAIIGFVGMYASIKGFVKLFAQDTTEKNNSVVNRFIFDKGYKTFFTGWLGTALVHSSSATISILQTVVSSYKIAPKKAFIFILGANIGTTFTALLAGLFKNETALQLAFAHLLFNVLGAFIFGVLPVLNTVILRLAGYSAKYFEKYRSYLIIYISFLFFIIPLLLIYIFRY